MSSKANFDLIIIGGGVLGAFHAYFALQKGLKVLLLEKDPRPTEATVRNFGQIVPSGMADGEWFRYGKASLETYKSIQAEFNITIRQNGSTYIASSETEMQVLQEKHQQYQNVGYPSELLTAAQCRQRLPALKESYCFGGLLFPEEVTAEPATLIHRLLEYLVTRLGLDYRPATPVIACTFNDVSCEVRDVFGQVYTAAKVIICSGRDFKFLFPEVFQTSDLQICKLQMLATYPLPQVALPGSILTGLSIRRYYAFKSCPSYAQLNPAEVAEDLRQWGIHILFKQALDGSIIIGDSHEYADTTATQELDYGVEDTINAAILREAQQILHLPDWRIKRTWNGYYSQSKSAEIFEHVIDQKIHIVTGIGGKGMTTAAGFAQHHVQRLGY
ncbi:TIGR03364 family FAD-dependent oxidoreductase [Adhaeribacter arboris]|uniref:TIGR03364 family FAD-dependent oxidoreductase n=1 Tax=Adhaeribacter arboris TaxID=2072846 RepID=A0A2T2YK25_9BACT|nr:TIGR03364 family FAD-dependent oxidoreductase [Adhaeribacter arboris]PSR55852.1 TIGR03364 family FAD-dependent oxidoreductase [Adhaeribacter arboris]